MGFNGKLNNLCLLSENKPVSCKGPIGGFVRARALALLYQKREGGVLEMFTFKHEMGKLVSKYGKCKVSNDLCNEIWKEVKSKSDQFIKDRVTYIMCHKSIHGAVFAVAEFLEAIEYRKPSNGGSGRKVEHRALRKEREVEFLQKYLKEIGAKSVIEAVEKIKNERKKKI